MTLTNEYLRYITEYEQNSKYQEMAKELLALRLLNEMREEVALQRKGEKEDESQTDYSICDDCDMTYPCCNKCIGA
jgi:hypothetical protein